MRVRVSPNLPERLRYDSLNPRFSVPGLGISEIFLRLESTAGSRSFVEILKIFFPQDPGSGASTGPPYLIFLLTLHHSAATFDMCIFTYHD